MIDYTKTNLGEFQEKDCGKWFTYRLTTDPWALSHGLTHELDVLDGIRFATIRKTVATVCTDEAASGEPVCDKWQIKKHYSFT